MKFVILNLVLSFTLLLSSCITKRNIVPIIPARAESGYLYYYRWVEDYSLPFDEYDKFFKVLKDAKCTYMPSNRIKFGFKTIRLHLETDIGTMTFSLPSQNDDERELWIQDIDNNLCYTLSNPDHIQWTLSIRDKMANK